MADLEALAENLSELTVMEAANLVKMLEDKWGVSAAAPAAVAVAAAGLARWITEPLRPGLGNDLSWWYASATVTAVLVLVWRALRDRSTRVGPVGAKAGDPAVDEPGKALGQRLGAEPELRHDIGTEVLDEHV